MADRIRLALDDAIDHLAAENVLARAAVERAGEDDRGDVLGNDIFKRFAVRRVRKIKVENGDGIITVTCFNSLTQRFKGAAMCDLDTVRSLQAMLENRGKHAGILDQKHSFTRMLLDMISPRRRLAKAHVPSIPW